MGVLGHGACGPGLRRGPHPFSVTPYWCIYTEASTANPATAPARRAVPDGIEGVMIAPWCPIGILFPSRWPAPYRIARRRRCNSRHGYGGSGGPPVVIEMGFM